MTRDTTPLPLPKRIVAAALASLAVVLTAHLANLVALFIANQTRNEALAAINSYFIPATLVAFVLLAVLFFVGAHRRWYLLVVAGVVTGIVAAVIGTILTFVQAGNTVTGGVFEEVVRTLGGVNLVYVIALTVSTIVVGPRIHRLVAAQPFLGASTVARVGTAIVRLPAANLSDGQTTHIERVPVDGDKADTQWDAYLEALTENGWGIVEVEPAPDLADSVFVEDAVVVFGGVAVLASPGSESREPEIEGVERTVRQLGLRIERIEKPGTLDGGDVLKVGSTVYVGRGGRTNAEGIRQLRAIVTPLGYTVVAVPVTKVLHLKSAVTALPDGTVIGYPPLVDDPGVFDRFLAVPEEGGAHVVVLGPDAVLMAASAPQSAALISELGYRVVTVDISEFEKLEGCVTCLSVRLR